MELFKRLYGVAYGALWCRVRGYMVVCRWPYGGVQ